MEKKFIDAACGIVKNYTPDFVCNEETIFNYPHVVALAQFLAELSADVENLTHEDLKDKYVPDVYEDPLKQILSNYIQDEILLDAAVADLDNYLEPKFTITSDDITAAARAMCESEGHTWWTKDNIEQLPRNLKNNAENINQYWVDKATTVFQTLVNRR